MTQQEYINAKIKSGHQIHFANGVWWENSRKGYCKTALLYQPLDTGESRPFFKNSYIGFNHRVNSIDDATGVWNPFIMTEEVIRNWSFEEIKSASRRSSIRRGIKMNKVLKVSDINEYKESLSYILKSTAIRNGHGHPPEYYDLKKSGWWDVLNRVSNYSEFWCAFQEEKLAAYISLHVIGDRAIVDGVKSDTEMLANCPIDAIIYQMILSLRERGGVSELWYGGKSNRPTLDKFKESFGLRVIDVPYKTYLLGGAVGLPQFLNKFIKRNDAE